jgi:hypothetical protein
VTYNKNWPRWIKASLFRHIQESNTSGPNYHLFFEGQHRKTSDESSWIEVRLDGPWPRQITAPHWKIAVELNILLTCNVARDLYAIDRMIGEIQAMFLPRIAVYKLGNGPEDNASELLGCLTLDTSDHKHGAFANQYGQIEPKIHLQQATVEGRYWMDLP